MQLCREGREEGVREERERRRERGGGEGHIPYLIIPNEWGGSDCLLLCKAYAREKKSQI